MEIRTKFNINDEVWFVHPNTNRSVQGRIKEIKIRICGKENYKRINNGKLGLICTGEYEPQQSAHIYYIDDNVTNQCISKSAYDIYQTKEELIESLN